MAGLLSNGLIGPYQRKRADMKKFVTVEEIAEHWNVSKAHVRRIIASGDLPSLRLGRALRVSVEALEQFENERIGVEES